MSRKQRSQRYMTFASATMASPRFLYLNVIYTTVNVSPPVGSRLVPIYYSTKYKIHSSWNVAAIHLPKSKGNIALESGCFGEHLNTEFLHWFFFTKEIIVKTICRPKFISFYSGRNSESARRTTLALWTRSRLWWNNKQHGWRWFFPAHRIRHHRLHREIPVKNTGRRATTLLFSSLAVSPAPS